MLLLSHKLFLHLFNFAFLLCGVALFACGILLISDESRMLISTLLIASNETLSEWDQPLFFYISLAFASTGMLIILISFVGCWAAFINKFCILFIYFSLVLLLLLTEFGLCLLITMWPHCLGPNLNSTAMVRALQGNYGVSGKEQFTAAIDLTQTMFECCAINSDNNYDTSLWRLQGLGHRFLAVPLTCCHLKNQMQEKSYLDPMPINVTLCQSLQKSEHETSRHSGGCIEKIEQWYREQYLLFLLGSLIVAIVQFMVLLAVILNCTKMHRKQVTKNISPVNKSMENIYQNEIPPVTQLGKIATNRYVGDANQVGLWSTRYTPTSQY